MKQLAYTVLIGVLSGLLIALPTACSATTVAQDIVNWTPTIVSAATTIDSVIASLDPPDAVVITGIGTTFTAAAELVDSQAQTYLANPTATALQQLQAQALAFQTNVNTALLQAAHISNSASQQRILTAINAGVTGISAILALISTIKGNSLTPASVTAPKLSMVIPRLDRQRDVAIVADHYGVSIAQATVLYDNTAVVLERAGF